MRITGIVLLMSKHRNYFLEGGVLCSSSYYDDLYSDNEWYEDEEEIEGWF